jgi:hypothetical protein
VLRCGLVWTVGCACACVCGGAVSSGTKGSVCARVRVAVCVCEGVRYGKGNSGFALTKRAALPTSHPRTPAHFPRRRFPCPPSPPLPSFTAQRAEALAALERRALEVAGQEAAVARAGAALRERETRVGEREAAAAALDAALRSQEARLRELQAQTLAEQVQCAGGGMLLLGGGGCGVCL